jgi:hypothetical protein
VEIDSSVFRALRGAALVGATGAIQVLAQLVLSWLLDVVPTPRFSKFPTFYMLSHSILAVLVLMSGHMLQVTIWAWFYYFKWGEFGNFHSALYFSLSTFTTLGANDLSLSPGHRMAGAIESAAGMLMFGWSTALLVKVVHQTDNRPLP